METDDPQNPLALPAPATHPVSPSPKKESLPSSPPPPPPSPTSSPSHEFSFTITLHPPTPLPFNPSAPIPELDLSPADDIFFHGHLLPLHLLSHRPSNASLEAYPKQTQNRLSSVSDTTTETGGEDRFTESVKFKSFSSSAIWNWLRGSGDKGAEKPTKKKKKKTLDVGRLLKKYVSFVEPLLFFKAAKQRRELRRSPLSFSGDCNPREGGWRRRWRGEFSAPASMRTSPANSGLLVAPPAALSSSDESTMEELQNAIQAAILHCKNSIAAK